MAEARTEEVVAWLDGYLRIDQVPDYPMALNGLQMENRGRVRRIAAAVDASERAIRTAQERGCDLLLVHHGLFWDGNQPVTGRRYRKLARALDMEPTGWFGNYGGSPVGCWGELEVKREVLTARLDDVLGGRVRVVAGGPEIVRRVGVVTGGGGGMIAAALAAGLDALVTGEGAHHTYFDAEEGGINVYFGGHYATETFGVRALAERVGERFALPWEFLDLPTGT